MLLSGLLLALLVSCAAAPGKTNRVPRVDAGYTHWLEQQSFLNFADKALPGSGGWGAAHPSGTQTTSNTPSTARIWLFVQPQSLIPALGRGVLETLADPETLFIYDHLGISGVYIDTPCGTGAMWQPRRAGIEADTDPTVPQLADDMGDPREWDKLAQLLDGRHMALGTSLLSPVTGAGPDFLLALQNVRQWPMAYGLINVPREQWHLLPTMAPPEENAPPSLMPLSAEKTAELRKAGLLPPADTAEDSGPLRWAVSGEAKGHDGKTRRWIYRMYLTPWRPVLLWDDPSATTRRMMTGAAQQALSMSGVKLAGLHLKAVQDTPETLTAILRDMSRMARRDGAMLVQRDRLPLQALKNQQESGADLMLDSVTAPAVEYALLSGDAGPLRAALDASLKLGLDHSRLLRPLTLSGGVDFADLRADLAASPPGLPMPVDFLQTARDTWGAVLPIRGERVQATLPTLAAMRMGLAPSPAIMAATGENRGKLLPLHVAVLQFRGGLPGTLEVTGQDLMGVLYNPLGLAEYPELLPDSPVSLPGWGPGERTAPSNMRGVPAGVTLYPPLLRQAGEADSFAAALQRMAKIRTETGLAAGQVVARIPTTAPGVVAVLSQTASGSHVLTVANFGNEQVDEQLVLPAPASGPKTDLWTGKPISPGPVTLRLPALSCRLLLIQGGSGGTRAPDPKS